MSFISSSNYVLLFVCLSSLVILQIKCLGDEVDRYMKIPHIHIKNEHYVLSGLYEWGEGVGISEGLGNVSRSQ